MKNRFGSCRFISIISAGILLVWGTVAATVSYGENSGVPSVSRDKASATRIVGGFEAQPGDWPFMGVLLSANARNPYYEFYCAVSLIAPSWALTAAHCVVNGDGSFNPNQKLDVIIGIHDLEERQGERIHVAEIILNADYDYAASDGDIALLRLERPSKAMPVTLVEQNTGTPIVTSGNSTVLGWGATQTDGTGGTDVLLQVTVPVVTNEECQRAEDSQDGYGATITDNMVCAGLAAGGKDACFGDSGGPLMIYENNQWTQIGIVSFGPFEGCALPNAYGVYTRVSQYRDWIDDQMEDTTPDQPPYEVLTDSSSYVVRAGSAVTVYGSEGQNNIRIEAGASATLLNFPGSNVVTLESSSALFTVSRSGATVTFQGTDGTVFSMPATPTPQSIVFSNESFSLRVDSGAVRLGDQVVGLTATPL